MPKLLFTDEQKATLAKEAGITGVPDTNTFDKEYDPSTGEQKLYMKLGTSGKFFGAKPTTVKIEGQDALNAQVDYVKQQFGGKTMQDIYGAMISTAPSTKVDIRNKIAAGPGGIGSQLEGITQQIQNLQKLKAGNQSEIFNAIDPNTGQPVDPRVAVATYQNRQKALTEQENNLRSLEDMYNSQLQALTDSEYSRQAAENEKNKTALSYLKDIEDRKTASEKIATDKSQFDAKLAEEKRQYNITNGIGTDTMEGLSTVSFADKAYLYPNEASLKNNNPAGIKNSITDRTRQLLIDAGVKWEGGTKPPPGESGQYMKFASVADGVKAHRVLLTSAGTDDVEGRLKQWVGTAEGPNYAKQLMDAAGIEKGAKFSSLSEEQMNKLVSAQMQKESPGFYKELQAKTSTNTTTTTTKKPKTFNEFIEKYQVPDVAGKITGDTKDMNEEQIIKYAQEKLGIKVEQKDSPDATREALMYGVIDKVLESVLQDYPTEKKENVAQAIMNRSPDSLKPIMEKYSAKLNIDPIRESLPTMEKTGVKVLTNQLYKSMGGDAKSVIETLNNAGFFDIYGPHWHGDDDQYDAIQEFAKEKGVNLDEILKTLNG